jgi:hypothetical protein
MQWFIFFQTNVKFFLEGVDSEEGISTGPDKVKTVQDWPRPKTPKQMRGLSWSLVLLQEICEKTLQFRAPEYTSGCLLPVVTLTCSRVVAHYGSLFSSVFLS